MSIKNYTSKVSSFASIGEIQQALASHGANQVMVDYQDGKPTAVTFSMATPCGNRAFRLPAAVSGTMAVFKRQGIKPDPEQAEITAWRNVRDWVLAQIALVESCNEPMDKLFLPYMTGISGQTLYDVYAAGTLLPGGDPNG